MTDKQVQGSPDSMRTAGRVSANSSTVYGNQASTADAVTKNLSVNKSTNNTKAMSFAQALANGKRQVAEAHQKVSEMLPKVATAVEDAQHAETKMNDAKTKLAAANKAKATADKDLQTANTNLQSAQLKLTLAQATPLTATPPSAGGSAPGPNPAAVAAAEAALAAAKAAQVVAQTADKVATTAQHTAQDTYNKDVKAFDEANTKRKTALTKLNNLYHEESAKARAALAALGPIPTLAASPAGLDEQDQLHNEISGLADVDRLANDGEIGEHAQQIEQSYNQSASDDAKTASQGLNLMALWGRAYDPNSIVPTPNPAFVAHTSQLVQSAANGDTKAIAELRGMSSLSQQKEFSEALLLHLGAKKLEEIPLQMGEGIAASAPTSASTVPASKYQADQMVLAFLGDSLASASHADDPQMAASVTALTKTDGADNVTQLDPTLARAITADPNAKGAGYWSLGQILGAASGKVPFDPSFVKTMSDSLVQFEQQNGNKDPFSGPASLLAPGDINRVAIAHADDLNLGTTSKSLFSQDGNLPSSDPAYGLLHVAGFNTASARAALGTDTTNFTNLEFYMNHSVAEDGGAALGKTLNAATLPNDKTTGDLLSVIIPTAASNYDNGTYNKNLTGLSQSLATILGRNMSTVNDVLFHQLTVGKGLHGTVNGSDQARLGSTQLLTVLGNIEQDPTAYKTLQTAELSYITRDLDAKAGTTQFQQALTEDANVFGTLILARATVGQGLADASEAQKQKLLGLLSNGKDVLGDLGVEGKGLEIAGQLLGVAQDQSSASTAATTKGAQGILQLPSILQILTVEAFAKKGDLRQIAPTAGGEQQLNKEFIGKNGQLILPTTQAQAYDFAKWIGDLKVSPATMNSINSGISAASGLSGNESRGNGVGSAP